jgi:hypothetical protein
VMGWMPPMRSTKHAWELSAVSERVSGEIMMAGVSFMSYAAVAAVQRDEAAEGEEPND